MVSEYKTVCAPVRLNDSYVCAILFFPIDRVFLLQLLTDKEHRNIIQWQDNQAELKFVEPESVAKLWDARINKPNMNYEKLSRALRYYYKVKGKNYCYKFVCDLK